MNHQTKKAIDTFFSERYQDLLRVANIFITNHSLDPDDMISTLYLSFLDSGPTAIKGLENAIDRDNLFNLAFSAIRNQALSSSSKFNKQLIKNRTDYVPQDGAAEEYTPSNEEVQWLIATKELHNLKDENIITDYEYNIFSLMYNFEEIIDIKGFTKEETDSVRKQSLRKLSKQIDIGYMSIYTLTEKVKTLLINRINNKSIII